MAIETRMKRAPTALIVDDEQTHNRILKKVLNDFGLQVVSTQTCQEFLGQFKHVKPDVCLVDLNIETLGVGFTIVRAIRNVHGHGIPVLIVSGRSDIEALEHAIAVGANDYLTKPLDRHILAAKLSRYVRTEQLLVASNTRLIPVPDAGTPAEAQFDCEVTEVNEHGMLLWSPHLFNKGSVFNFSGPLPSLWTKGPQPIVSTVVSTWHDHQRGGCFAFAEFDSSDLALLAAVRQWLANQTKQKGDSHDEDQPRPSPELDPSDHR